MTKTVRKRHAQEFKREAVRLVHCGQSIAATARALCIARQTLSNWVNADRQGKLTCAESKVVGADKREIRRLQEELTRVTMERDSLGRAIAYFAKASS